ncbi:MAG: PDZ domain-containing protein [Planctomycetota bacterium]|nr:MAG: PDZ domain-containing protein [Planctomycetota bacterium]
MGPAAQAQLQLAEPPPQREQQRLDAREVLALVEQLRSDDFAVREAASEALVQHAEALERTLQRGQINLRTLTPEQKIRLMEALERAFARAPRGGMGIQFAGGQPGLSPLTIQRTVPGFPAAQLLLPGDVILGIDGVRVDPMDPESSAIVRHHILSHNPGETIPLVVQRRGRELQLEVPLGRFDRLANPQTTPPLEDLHSAWRIRAARLGLVEEDAIVPQTLSEAGEDASLGAGDQFIALLRSRSGVVAGGAPLTDPANSWAVMGGSSRALQIATQTNAAFNGQRQRLNQQEAQLRAELFRKLQLLRLTEAQHRKLATNPNMPEEARKAARDSLEAIRSEILRVQKQLAEINGRP